MIKKHIKNRKIALTRKNIFKSSKNKRFDELSEDNLKEIEKLLYNRPRKVLGCVNKLSVL